MHNTPAPNNTALVNLCVAMRAYWIDNQLTQQSLNVTMREVYATSYASSTAPTGEALFPGGTVGLLNLSGEPGGTTLAVSFRTADRGRSARGRNFWVGLPKTNVTGNQVDPTYMQAIEATYAGMVGAGAVQDEWTWGVCSFEFNKQPRAAGLFRVVTSALCVNNDVDSQRRRLSGRGQ